MNKFIFTTLFILALTACTNGDQPPDNSKHMKQEGVGSTSSSNATTNQELDTNTYFNSMSKESYHQSEDPLESNSTREAQGFKNSAKTPQDTRLSGSATQDSAKGAEKNTEAVIQEIEKRIRSQKSLSNLAKQVEVVGLNDNLFLNGNVQTEQEKKTIESIARKFAANKTVTSQIKILEK